MGPVKLRSLSIPLFLFAAFSVVASAQIGIYGKFDITRYSGPQGAGFPIATRWFYGPGIGVYYDFMHLGPVAVGADLRGNLLFASQYRYRSALFGVRLSAKAPVLPIGPYIQGSVGAGGPRYTGGGLAAGISSVPYSTKFQYQVFGGIDYTVLPHLDLRLPEIGYGRMSDPSGSGGPSSSILTISSGLVFRFR